MQLNKVSPDVSTEDGNENKVYDNNTEQLLLVIVRELRKMNLQLETMTGEKYKDGDYDVPA